MSNVPKAPNLSMMLSESGEKDQESLVTRDNAGISSEDQNRETSPDHGGAVGSVDMCGQPAGPSHLQVWQNSGDAQQNTSFRKLLEVILQSLHAKQSENKQLQEHCAQLELKIRMDGYEKKDAPRTSREPVSRSKSAPETFQKQQFIQANEIRKSSDPEIFVFPDMKNRTGQNTQQNKENRLKSRSSDPVSEDGLKDSIENADSGSLGRDSNEFLSLKDSFHEPPGVSSQYFNNVINELLKTKTYLHSLQKKQQKCQKCEVGGAGDSQMDKMRNEVQRLMLKNQELQRELAAKEEEMAQVVKPEPVTVRDESFELSTESDVELSDSSKENSQQVSAEVEIQRLREENEELTKQNQMILQEKEELQKMLMKDNHEINRELIQLNDAYDRLKDNVKILSTCLQEEKVRSKSFDEKFRTKSEETRKLSAQLGSLRQQYEELRQEKNALEKTHSLEDRPSVRYASPYSQTRSSEFNRSGSSNRSGEYNRYGSNRSSQSAVSSKSGTSESYNIRPENWPPRLSTQNNLSSGENEPKLSNLPFTGASPPKYECPRCLRKFQVENSYLLHMQSCLD